MPLTLVTGRANTGKTDQVRRAIADAVRDGRLPVLLLPTLPDVRRAREWLAPELPLGVQIDQFERFAEGLWGLHGDGRTFVRDSQRAALVADAVDRHRSSLGSSGTTPGFTRFAARVARRVAEEPLWVIEQAEAADKSDGAMLELIRTYLSSLTKARLIEPAAAMRSLAESAPPLHGMLAVHDFSDLGAAQEAMLTSWAEQGRDIWLTLPWERGFPATAALDALAARMFAHAGRIVECAPGEASGDDELQRLEAGLFGSPEPRTGSGAVTFCATAGEEAEAALIARQAAELVKRSEDPDRVAIVFRDAERHVEAIRRSLAAAGVPAHIDVRVCLSRTPLGLAVAQLLRFQASAEAAADRVSLAAFLRGPFSGAEPLAVDRLEREWRRARVTERRRVAAGAMDLGERPRKALSLVKAIAEASAPNDRAVTWKDLANHLLATAHDVSSLQTSAEAVGDIAAHRTLIEAVGDLTAVGRGAPREVLAALDEAMTTPGESERPGHVQVTEAHRLRARRFDSIVVGGLTAGEFSAEGAASAASELVDRLFCAERPTEQAKERLLFYSVVTRARERLVLTRQASTAEGEALRPSVFWDETLDLFREPSADEEQDVPRGAVPFETLGLAELEEAAPAVAPERFSLRVAASDHDSAADPRVAHALARTCTSRGRLADEALRARLAERRVFSATELEAYAQCPYKWFYERVVRPEGIDGELGAMEQGSLAHRVLRRVYERLPQNTGSRRVTRDTLEMSLELADAVFAEEAAPPRTPPALTLMEEEEELRRVLRTVRELLVSDADFLLGFEPTGLEVSFGREDEPEADLGEFALKGSIDRVDLGAGGLVIMDYKRGGEKTPGVVAKRRLLQLPLYAAVAAERFDQPVVAAFYRYLGARGRARGFYLDGAVGEEGLASTDRLVSAGEVRGAIAVGLEAAKRAVEGIRRADIAPDDPAEDACKYCSAASFCPRGR